MPPADPNDLPDSSASPAPCPWCEQPNPMVSASYEKGQWAAWCLGCGASGKRLYATDEEAIAAWNRVALAPKRLKETRSNLKRLIEASQDVVCTEMSDSWCQEFVAALEAARKCL